MTRKDFISLFKPYILLILLGLVIVSGSEGYKVPLVDENSCELEIRKITRIVDDSTLSDSIKVEKIRQVLLK